jgi:hypothetical protein
MGTSLTCANSEELAKDGALVLPVSKGKTSPLKRLMTLLPFTYLLEYLARNATAHIQERQFCTATARLEHEERM